MCIVHVSRRPFRGQRWALTPAAKALLSADGTWRRFSALKHPVASPPFATL